MNFLFWFFIVGIVVASLQDLKRREVDNWLNYLLLVSGAGFLIFSAVLNWDFNIILMGVFGFILMFGLGNLFYYGRVFAGGDAKLMIAMFALFVSSSIIGTLQNVGVFVIFLLIGGAVWGLVYGVGLVVLNLNNFTKGLRKDFSKYKRYSWLIVLVFVILIVLSFLDSLFWIILLFVILLFVLMVFAKALENSVMIKEIGYSDLREGDWLVEDVRVGKKIVRSHWEGLTQKDLEILKKVRKKVLIKEGIPFVPGFLIALICYGLFRDVIFGVVRGFLA